MEEIYPTFAQLWYSPERNEMLLQHVTSTTFPMNGLIYTYEGDGASRITKEDFESVLWMNLDWL